MVSIIDSHGLETGRTAPDSTALKNLDLSDVNGLTKMASPEMMTGRNFSVGLETGLSTARS